MGNDLELRPDGGGLEGRGAIAPHRGGRLGDILVKGGTLVGGRIRSLTVGLLRLPDRAIDRDQAIRWLRDGHSLVPVVGAARLPALQLVEVGEGHAIRTDNQPVDEDTLPAALTGGGR